MLDNERFNAIVDATCYWLGYQFKIGRDKLIHEASLRYPIADTITAKGISIDRINLEKGHPFFEDKVVDLLIFDKKVAEINVKNFNESISEMHEFKIAKNSTNTKFGNEHQRVIDDVLRLAYFNLITKKDCYFLMCGKYDEFNAYFLGKTKKVQKEEGKKAISSYSSIPISTSWNADNSLYRELFKFKINDTQNFEFTKNEIPLDFGDIGKKEKDELLKQLKFGLMSFQERYKIKNNLLQWKDTLEIKTTCVAISLYENNPTKTHAAAIWKIEGLN